MKNCAQIIDCFLRSEHCGVPVHPELLLAPGDNFRKILSEGQPADFVIFSSARTPDELEEKLKVFPDETALLLKGLSAEGSSVRFIDSESSSFASAFESTLELLANSRPVVLVSANSFKSPGEDSEQSYVFALLLSGQSESSDRNEFLNAWNRGPFLAVMQKDESSGKIAVPPADALVMRWLLSSSEPFMKCTDAFGVWLWAKNARFASGPRS